MILPAQPAAQIVSDADELWNASDHNENMQEWSHWRGKGMWAEQKWQATGIRHFKMYEELCMLTNHPRPAGKMVEWGSGGGANAIRFCTEVSDFYGTDISAANLDECQKQVEAAGFGGFHPVLFDAAHPEQCLQLIQQPVDFFLSTAVFQHFPSKEYGIQVTEIAYKLLSETGIAMIQTRFDDGSIRHRPKHRNYTRDTITFTSYRIDEFWEIATAVGFRPINVVLAPKTRYAYYFLAK